MKLHGRTKNKITYDENDENVPNLGITEVAEVQYKIFNNEYQRNSSVLYKFIPNKSFVTINNHLENFIFLKPFIQSVHILKHHLLIDILNCQRQITKKLLPPVINA